MNTAKKTAFLGLMLAVMTVLTMLEHMLPPIPFLPPNVKLGLSNIVPMYLVFFGTKTDAIALNALKSVFVFLMRGPVAGLLSFCGGMVSIVIVVILVIVFKDKISYIVLGIVGAVAHNLGQILAFAIVMKTTVVLYYFPILIISGIFMGIITGTLSKTLLPVLRRTLK